VLGFGAGGFHDNGFRLDRVDLAQGADGRGAAGVGLITLGGLAEVIDQPRG
jgi:hypothetical protein